MMGQQKGGTGDYLLGECHLGIKLIDENFEAEMKLARCSGLEFSLHNYPKTKLKDG